MSDFARRPVHRYQDPLALTWIACAERVGFRVRRTADAYASSDGKGTLLIAEDGLFDPDDCLGQMIFHELCHALVEGEAGESREDWGLGYAVGGNPWREHACLRVQAWLAGNYGLRDFLAPTTDFRVSFWDSLPADPLAAPEEQGGRREKSCVAARRALQQAAGPRWAKPLAEALEATAALAAAVAPLTQASAVPGAGDSTGVERLPSLWSAAVARPPLHPAGHAPVADYHSGLVCADCAWSFVDRGRRRCRHAPKARLPEGAPACTRFEPAAELDCQTCGACCREAYDSVEISSREPVNRRHPELVVVLDTHRKLRREGERCAALAGGRTPAEPYACTIYEDRPRTCRDFTRGSGHCLEARRRVGLSL
jgi:hypothetical protein